MLDETPNGRGPCEACGWLSCSGACELPATARAAAADDPTCDTCCGTGELATLDPSGDVETCGDCDVTGYAS